MKEIYDVIKQKFIKIVEDNNLKLDEIIISAVKLSPLEAIGNPEDKDYPILIGKERIMQAEFRGSLGQAFTDMYGNFHGSLNDILSMKLVNNFRRAIFVSSLNAVMRYLGLINKTTHCRDNEPKLCSQELVNYIIKNYGKVKIALVGLQPRMVEALSDKFEIRVTDLDKDNIGTHKHGVFIGGLDKTTDNLLWCDIALVTGTTVVNNTIEQFISSKKPTIFYGVTISGVAKLLDLKQFCHCGH